MYGCYKKTSSEDLQDKYSLAEENEQLKKQLAEKEKENLTLFSMLYETLEKQGCENIVSTIEQMTNLTLEKQSNWFKGNCVKDQDKISFTIDELEKVKELLNTDFESIISWIDPYEDGECLTSMTYNHNNTIKIIDNQIKQLKGEVYE